MLLNCVQKNGVRTIPFKYTLAVPHGYISKPLSAEYDVRHVAKEHATEGIVSVKSDLGNDLRAYCIERTLCELLHKPSELDKERFIPAIRKYAATPEKDFLLLMKFGRIFHVEKKLLSYLEAINSSYFDFGYNCRRQHLPETQKT